MTSVCVSSAAWPRLCVPKNRFSKPILFLLAAAENIKINCFEKLALNIVLLCFASVRSGSGRSRSGPRSAACKAYPGSEIVHTWPTRESHGRGCILSGKGNIGFIFPNSCVKNHDKP